MFYSVYPVMISSCKIASLYLINVFHAVFQWKTLFETRTGPKEAVYARGSIYPPTGWILADQIDIWLIKWTGSCYRNLPTANDNYIIREHIYLSTYCVNTPISLDILT